MKFIKKFLVFALTFAIVSTFTACQTAEEKQNEVIDIKPLVVVITDVGGIGDHSFNDAALAALEAAEKDHDINIRCLEAETLGQYEDVIKEAVNEDAVLTVAVGSNMEKDLAKVAKEYPDKYFGIVDGKVEADNVYSITFADNESSFLAGYVAAKTTKTGKIGFIAGDERDTAELFEAGFEAGAHQANPNVEVETDEVGSFYDADRGYRTAVEMINEDNVDVLMHIAGPSGIGIIKAGVDKGIWVIGADEDQSVLGSKNVLCSAVKNMEPAMKKMVDMALDGNFKGGYVIYNMKDGGVDISDQAGNIPAELMKEVKDIKEKIVKGEITVPENDQPDSIND